MVDAPRPPRVVLHRFAVPADPAFRAWQRTASSLIAPIVDEGLEGPPPQRAIIWRMESSNRRIMATSAGMFDTIAAAHGDAVRVVDGFDRFDVAELIAEKRHSWRLELDARPAVIAGRWYDKVRDRDEALARALAAFRLGTEPVLAPPPFDMARQEWVPGADVRAWREQVLFELAEPVRDRPARQHRENPHRPGDA